MRAFWWFAVGLASSLPVFAACTLTTDLDHLADGSGSGGLLPDGGDAASSGASGDAGASTPDARAGAEAGPTAPSYGDQILADHPIAYFPFDEPAGSGAVTEKVSGTTASAKKAAYTFGVPGVAGTALAATGAGDLEFGDRLDMTGRHAWSLEAWIKPELQDGKVFYEYFNKRYNGNNGIVAYVRNENGETTVQVEQNYPGGGGRGVSAELGALDHFIHIVFVYDPGSTGIRVWVDGERSDKGYDDDGGPTDNPQSVFIASGVKGTIDEMAFYDYALPDARVAAHYAAGTKK